MRVLVTGATGFVGRPLCNALFDARHEVHIVSRSPARARQAIPFAKTVTEWHPLAQAAPAAALENCDAIVHLLGETVNGRWTERKKSLIYDSRVVGTQNLVQGLRECSQKPSVLVSASAIGYYGDRGDEALTEDSSAGEDFFGDLCLNWELSAEEASSLGVRVAKVRVGLVMAADGGTLERMLLPFKLGLGGALGSGRQWWSWIHRDDLISLILFALNNPVDGPLSGSSPEPLRQIDFAKVLARTLHRPCILPVPAFVLKTLFGEFAFEILSSKQIRPERTLQTGFTFQYPDLASCLSHILAPKDF